MSNMIDDQSDQSDGSQQRPTVNLFQIIWQRKSLVLLGVVAGLVIGALVYANQSPVYTSIAQVLVVKKGPDNIISGGDNSRMMMMEDYLATHTTLLKSAEIISMAVRSKELDDLKMFGGIEAGEKVAMIHYGLQVLRESKDASGGMTNILNLTYKGPVADESPKVLNAIINQYQIYLNAKYKSTGDQTLDMITSAEASLRRDIDKLTKEYQEFRASSAVVVLPGATDSFKEYTDRLAAIEIRRAGYRKELAEKGQRLKKIEQIYAEQGAAGAISYMIATGMKVTMFGGERIDEEMSKFEADLSSMKAMGIGPMHPTYRALEERKNDYYKRYLARTTGNAVLPEKLSSSDAEAQSRKNLAQTHIEELRLNVADNEMLLTAADVEHDKISKEFKDKSFFFFKDKEYSDNISRLRASQDVILKKLLELNLIKDPGGFTANVITPPGYGRKTAPLAYQVFTVAGLLGFLCGVGLAYLAEMSDKSFRNPAEIRRRMGLPVIGHIPFLPANEKATKSVAGGVPTLDPMLITHYESISVGAEAYRGVRTSLYFSTHGAGHQVVQVTSPNVSDGKSTLAANLAVSIAQSGKRTVILDADFRKPRVHKIFNVPNGAVGLATMVQGKASLEECVQQSEVPNLSILPCGPRPANPAELLTSPRFKQVLDEIRQAFDFVIVDTPPLLVVTDPSVVAPRVDGVVLCIRVTKNGRPYAERAKEVLASVGANVLGVVVNGFGSQAGGNRYGYEHYQYGDGDYTYGYSYSYTSKDEDDGATYYTQPKGDEDAPVAAPKA